MKVLTWACILLLALIGCADILRPNQAWLDRRGIPYTVKIIPATLWPAYAQFYSVPPHACGFFMAPGQVFVREGLEWFCLEHELCHVREHALNVPYHSLCASGR